MTNRGFDGRSTQARNARNYVNGTANFFALPLSAGNVTVFRLVTPEQFANMLKAKETRRAFEKTADGLRWKALQVVHAPRFDYVASFTIGKRIDELTIVNGNRSAEMEKLAAAALTLTGFAGEDWRQSDESDRREDGYKPDCVSASGLTVEVKGRHGRIFR